MVVPVVVALEMVACGGQRKRQKLAALHRCRCCCSCCLTGGHGWVVGVEVKLIVMIGWCLVISWLLLEERERGLPVLSNGEKERKLSTKRERELQPQRRLLMTALPASRKMKDGGAIFMGPSSS